VVIGPGVVCSRDANGCSGRGVRKHDIVAKVVSKRLGAGGVGKRAGVIEPAIRGVSGGATRRVGIGSGRANAKRRQLTWLCWTRASAQHHRAKIFKRGAANGRDATNDFRSSMNIRASVFAAWRVAWLCVACWIGNRVIERGAGIGVVQA
jgi:hypothetical protein